MPIRLKDILSIHEAYRRWTPLELSLGDGFLYCDNPVFRAVRDRATTLGIGFTKQDFCFYDVAPLAALGDILRARKVPYRDNVTVLHRAERRRPGAALEDAISVKGNVVMHETVHCIVDRELPRALFRRTRLGEARSTALRAAVGESLATSSEMLGGVPVDGPVQALFFERNSYTDVRPGARVTLKACIEEVGAHVTARVMCLSFLLANALFKELSNADCVRLLRLAGADVPRSGASRKALFDVGRMGLGLDVGFRLRSVSAYLRHEHGITQDPFRLNDYDVLGVLERSDALRTSIFRLCDALSGV